MDTTVINSKMKFIFTKHESIGFGKGGFGKIRFGGEYTVNPDVDEVFVSDSLAVSIEINN